MRAPPGEGAVGAAGVLGAGETGASCAGFGARTGVPIDANCGFEDLTRMTNSVFADNGQYGVMRTNSSVCQSRGNNTITGNGLGPTSGTISSFPPM